MPIEVLCPHCHKHYSAPDQLANRVLPCPNCKNAIQVANNFNRAAEQELFQDAAAGEFTAPPIVINEKTVAPGQCPACGKQVPTGSRICVACGQNVFEPVRRRGADESEIVHDRHIKAQHLSIIWPLLLIFISIGLSLLALADYHSSPDTPGAAITSGAALVVGIVSIVMLLKMGEMLLMLVASLLTAGSGTVLILAAYALIINSQSMANDPIPSRTPATSQHTPAGQPVGEK